MSWKLPELPPHVSPVEQQQLLQVLLEYQDLLAQYNSNLKHTQLIEHQIHIEGGPVWVPYCCQNPHIQQKKECQVKQILGQGIIYPSKTTWAAAVVMVRKNDGSLRFCLLQT